MAFGDPKPKRCKICRQPFVPSNSLHKVCSPLCAIQFAKTDDAPKLFRRAKSAEDKAARAKHRAEKEALKTVGDWRREAQAAFNKFIRLRDHDKPCISCGSTPNDDDLLIGSRWDAGHYRSTGSCPGLRFEELNCHRQCVKCNRNLSGNVVEYRLRLIDRIGADKLAWLEGNHAPKRFRIDDLKEIKKTYARKARELEKELNR